MSKMEKLASIFNKKLGEEFTIKLPTKYNNDKLKGTFTANGLEVEGLLQRERNLILYLLLKDEAIILEG